MKTQKPLEIQIGELLKKKKKTIALAESCTGGLASSKITDVSGSSSYFIGAIVSYSNDIKITLLDVSPEAINKHGAVSTQVAKEMAKGACAFLDTDLALSITGIAGPKGGSKKKPVGLAFIGFASKKKIRVKKILVKGTRTQIKKKVADSALKFLLENIR